MLTAWAFLGYNEIRRQPNLVPAETSIKNFVKGFPFLLGYEPSRRKCIHCKFLSLEPSTKWIPLMISQGRNNFSKTEGAAQKLGGQNIENHLILTIFGVEFQGKWVKISKNWGGSRPPCHPPSDAPVLYAVDS